MFLKTDKLSLQWEGRRLVGVGAAWGRSRDEKWRLEMQEAIYLVRSQRGQILGAFKDRAGVGQSAAMMNCTLAWESLYLGSIVMTDDNPYATVEMVPLFEGGETL